MTLQPQAAFTVVRQIENHLDSDTNYVQAVIRNAYTDAIIDTLQLTDKGGQRFSKNWQVPGDTSGQGFFISIVTSVYSDSGYTTKNPNYGDQENTHLVQDRVMRLGGGGGGIDAFTVRRIVKDELDSRSEALQAISDSIGALQREISHLPKDLPSDRTSELLKAISEAKTKPIDLGPVLSSLNGLSRAIEAKEVTPETDLRPVLSQIESVSQLLKKGIAAISEDVNTIIPEKVEEIMSNVKLEIAPVSVQPEIRQKESVPLDLNALSI